MGHIAKDNNALSLWLQVRKERLYPTLTTLCLFSGVWESAEWPAAFAVKPGKCSWKPEGEDQSGVWWQVNSVRGKWLMQDALISTFWFIHILWLQRNYCSSQETRWGRKQFRAQIIQVEAFLSSQWCNKSTFWAGLGLHYTHSFLQCTQMTWIKRKSISPWRNEGFMCQ